MSSPIPKDDFPDEMYLPPEVSSLGEIIPMQDAILVKATPKDTIRCQWMGCDKEFRATVTAVRYHFGTEHLQEDKDKWREIERLRKKKNKEIEKEEVVVAIEEGEETVAIEKGEEVVEIEEGEEEENPTEGKAEDKAEKSSEAIGAACLWMVNNRVPCTDIRKPGREDRAPKIYSVNAFEKHIGTHLYKEGLPSPYTKECKYCGRLYVGRGSGKRHLKECIGPEPGRKRAKFSHDEEEPDSDTVILA